MSESFYSLIYTSSAVPLMHEDALVELLAVARKANVDHGITGVLVYHEGCFVQYIEGAEAEVSQLYANICRDDRHKIVGKIDTPELSERMFPDWSMAFRRIDGPSLAAVAGEIDHAEALRKTLDLPENQGTNVFLKSCLSAMLPVSRIS